MDLSPDSKRLIVDALDNGSLDPHDELSSTEKDMIRAVCSDPWLEVTDPDSGAEVDLSEGVNLAITVASQEHDGTVRLNIRVTGEGIIADSYDADGNCVGTIGDGFDGWAARIEGDPAQKPLWEDDRIQFARLLDEIQATHSEIDFAALEESMDLERDDIDEIFERAQTVFQASKDQHGWLDASQASDDDTVWRVTRADITAAAHESGYVTPITDDQFDRIATCIDHSTVSECIDGALGQVLVYRDDQP